MRGRFITQGAGLMVMAAWLAAACATSTQADARDLGRIIASGTLNVGINPGLPPLGQYGRTNALEGFDIDIATQLAGALGVRANLVPVTSAGRIPYLMANKVDIILGGMTRSPERARVIAFSAPLYTEAFSILTPGTGHPDSLAALDRPDMRLVEARGSSAVPFVATHAPQAQVLLLDGYPDVIRALAQGRADAMIDVSEYVTHYLAAYPATHWHVTRLAGVPVDYDCVGLAQDNAPLLARLNQAIATMHRTHAMENTYEKWFGTPMAPLPAGSAP